MKKTNKKLMLITFVGFILFANLVLATPGIPNAFYGSVTWNGQPAPDGTTIVAKINGVEVASTITSDGRYGHDPIFYIDDPNNVRTGSIINLFVNGIDTGQTGIFCNGCVTLLDLTATGETTGDGGTNGGNGGTTGGIAPANETEETEEEVILPCQERWICTDWSECVEGIQTRECEDVNDCGTDQDKPLESQPCSTEEETQEGVGGLGITGMFGAIIQSPVYLSLLILVIIAIILVVLKMKIFKRRSK